MMFMVFVLCMAGTIHSAYAFGKADVKGTWDYKVPAAPYEYSTGKLIFDETEGKPAITVKFTNGSEIKAQDVLVEEDSFSFSVLIENESVKVSGNFANDQISGKVDSSQGVMDLTAEKSEQ